MNDKIKSFTDLHAWQEGHKLVISIYKITKTFPKEEIYSLIDQMHRLLYLSHVISLKDLGEEHIKKRFSFTTKHRDP